MSKPILYLFIGYPGAGKTSTAKIIAERTKAVHLWADSERHKLFPDPTHSEAESVKLYDYLNNKAGELLKSGESVVFDTNFNFYADRQKLRQIAEESGAGKTVIVWLTTPEEVARQRAVHTPMMRNGYMYGMSNEQFNAIISKLEPPLPDEANVIKVDGTNFNPDEIIEKLGI